MILSVDEYSTHLLKSKGFLSLNEKKEGKKEKRATKEREHTIKC